MSHWPTTECTAVAVLGLFLVIVASHARKEKQPASRRKAVFFGSQWGKSEKLALAVQQAWDLVTSQSLLNASVEDFLKYDAICIVIGTREGGLPPESAESFCRLLDDASNDFRFGAAYLEHLECCVLGIGDPNYNEHFCVPAKKICAALKRLGASEIRCALLGPADECDATALTKAKEFSEEAEVDSSGDSDLENAAQCGNEMLSSRQRKALTKEGYKIVGSHSAVKLCRWTKHHIRGRGGCYKHTFYGIQSYGCMESTPSLACANKCVFCWRHHTNPVAKEWKWKVDPPEMLVEQWVENHHKMIKQLKGVPGVTPERFELAKKVRHCALSLVGEPIMYPYINELLTLLHERHISTFLVTNAQFPREMSKIKHCTQLYSSVDAATKEELKAIDRPLHDDFWERFKESLSVMNEQKCRTVLRLTLVKKYNMTEATNFASVVRDAMPDFVEIKAVTYCGDNGKDSITMKDIPWHTEVKNYANAILEGLPHYDMACEHVHSCCILLAHKKFRIDGVWHTWIDYPKFFELCESGKEFEALDYSCATPSWALAGAVEEGFDPEDTRHRRN